MLVATTGLVAGCAEPVPATDSAPSPVPSRSVVVELYQSQGCSSCPPANAYLNEVADRPGVIALSFAVTYWDQLGWRDTFASPAFTERQWDYARAGGRGQVVTPQMIVNGRTALDGFDRTRFDAVLQQASRPSPEPTITAGEGAVAIGAGTAARPATVWLVRYDPRTQDVPIRAGENGGRTLRTAISSQA